MPDIYFFVQVRMASHRLPEKVLLPVAPGIAMIDMIHKRLAASRYFSPDKTYFLTTTNPLDDQLVAHFETRGWNYLRGDEANVYERFRTACVELTPDYFYRVCADNPFLAPALLDALGDRIAGDPELDYVSFRDNEDRAVIQTHYGFFGELVNASTFVGIDSALLQNKTREHVTPIFYENRDRFRISLLDMPRELIADDIRLTVDTQKDLETVQRIVHDLGTDVAIGDVYQYLRLHPDLRAEMRLQMTRNAK